MRDFNGKLKTITRGGLAKPYENGLFIITENCWVDGGHKIPKQLLNTVVPNESFNWVEVLTQDNCPHLVVVSEFMGGGHLRTCDTCGKIL